jgi:hypothetical protein
LLTCSFISQDDCDEEEIDQKKKANKKEDCNDLGLGPAFDAKFYKDQVCRMVAPDDSNRIVVSFLKTAV